MPKRRSVAALAAVLVVALTAAPAQAQWVPSGPLAAVLVVQDCTQTAGDVAVSRLDPPTVYLCPTVVRLVRHQAPGAEHFYFVHEFGHIAMQTSDEAAADCWAAGQLANAPHGQRYLHAAIEHFRRRPDQPSRRYGTPTERAERIRTCADEARSPEARRP
ncbi:MAG TPA: hypothetical protein VLD35_20160 [Caldimonas sp.]|nr:hypothetical protein [Caldimonas sp.]